MTFQEYIQEELEYYKEYYSDMNELVTDIDLEFSLDIEYTTQE
jgi:hypothetical protein